MPLQLPATLPESLYFGSEDLFKKLDKQKKAQQEAELAQKLPQFLGDVVFKAKGTPVKGIDFLQLIQDNQPGWFQWFSNGDLSLFSLTQRVAQHIDSKSLEYGETVQQMVFRLTQKLEDMGCLKCTSWSYNPSERKYRLTPTGKAILKHFQDTGKIGAVKVQSFMGLNFSSAQCGVNESRFTQIQAALTQNRLGVSGWDVMKRVKKLGEPLVSPFTYWERPVSLERLALDLGFTQVGDRSFLTQIKQLQESGLVEVYTPWLDSEPRVALTKRAKNLLQQDVAQKAFQINDDDITAMVDDTLAQIDRQKGSRKEHLSKVQQEFSLLEERIRNKRVELTDKQRALDLKLKANTTSELDKAEARAELTLLDRQLKLFNNRLVDLDKQVKLASQLYTQWLEFIAQKIEKLADAKLKVSISQNNRLLNEFLDNLKQLGAAQGMMQLDNQQNSQTLEEVVEENLIHSQVAVDMNLEDWESKHGLTQDTDQYLKELELLAQAQQALNQQDKKSSGSKS